MACLENFARVIVARKKKEKKRSLSFAAGFTTAFSAASAVGFIALVKVEEGEIFALLGEPAACSERGGQLSNY